MMPQGDILIDDLKVGDLVLLKCYMNHLEDIDIDALLKMVELEDFKINMYWGFLADKRDVSHYY